MASHPQDRSGHDTAVVVAHEIYARLSKILLSALCAGEAGATADAHG
jgi:hypothetical protein